jgi:hypothetical protein
MNNLESLAKAVRELGGTLRLGQKSFQHFAGRRSECEHACTFPATEYEVGLIRNEEGNYELLLDFWSTGKLHSIVGGNACKITQLYNVIETEAELAAQGFATWREQEDDQLVVYAEG